MHSTIVRIQNVFGFFTTVAFTVATVIALSTFIHPQSPTASLQLRNVQMVRGRPHYYSYKKEEYAHIRFDLDTDLNTLFNWNTKQVFLYIKAVYPSTRKGEPASEAIIWDAILPAASAPWHVNHWTHPQPKGIKAKPKPKTPKSKSKNAKPEPVESPYPRGEIHLANQRPKYQITDISGKLQNRTDVTLELSWNVQPWVGALVWANKVDLGMWLGLQGGVSEPFRFPAIGEKAVKKEDMGTEKGKEGYRLEVGGEHPVRKGGR